MFPSLDFGIDFTKWNNLAYIRFGWHALRMLVWNIFSFKFRKLEIILWIRTVSPESLIGRPTRLLNSNVFNTQTPELTSTRLNFWKGCTDARINTGRLAKLMSKILHLVFSYTPASQVARAQHQKFILWSAVRNKKKCFLLLLRLITSNTYILDDKFRIFLVPWFNPTNSS